MSSMFSITVKIDCNLDDASNYRFNVDVFVTGLYWLTHYAVSALCVLW